eukprot:s8286_g2.t1
MRLRIGKWTTLVSLASISSCCGRAYVCDTAWVSTCDSVKPTMNRNRQAVLMQQMGRRSDGARSLAGIGGNMIVAYQDMCLAQPGDSCSCNFGVQGTVCTCVAPSRP